MLLPVNIYELLLSNLATMFLSFGLIMVGYVVFRSDLHKRVKSVLRLTSVLYFVLFGATITGKVNIISANSELFIITRALMMASVVISIISGVLVIMLCETYSRIKLIFSTLLPLCVAIIVSFNYYYVSEAVYKVILIIYFVLFITQISLYIYYFKNKYIDMMMSKSRNNLLKSIKFTSVLFLSTVCVSIINILSSIFLPNFHIEIVLLNFMFYLVFAAFIFDCSLINKIIVTSVIVPVDKNIQTKIIPEIEDPYLSFFQNWIRRKQYSKTVTRDSLAQKMQLNNVEFAQYFKQVHGCSFPVWLNKVRIEEAKKMLVNNADIPIMQVAESVGMSITSFNRSFANYEGVSPSEYRANNK